MEPAEAVALAEGALREAVRSVLPDWAGANGAPNVEELQLKQQEDAKRRDGTVPTEDLLGYTELHHLGDLICKNWEPFKPIFDDLQRTKVFLGLLLDYRNSVAHNRELVGFERDLLSGASGQLRSQVLLYRTRNDPSSAHYPVIESVVDGFGQALEHSDNVYAWRNNHETIRLDVGERLQFTCVGWDSQERPLTWCLRVGGSNLSFMRPLFALRGRRATFALKIRESWVTECLGIGISIASPGPYHRHSSSVVGPRGQPQDFRRDDDVYGYYAVNPPRG